MKPAFFVLLPAEKQKLVNEAIWKYHKKPISKLSPFDQSVEMFHYMYTNTTPQIYNRILHIKWKKI